MEDKDNAQSTFLEGEIVGVKFGLASHKEISTASVSGCSISHSSQLTNPFLGLPLEFGKCESCGTSEPGKCEGHFGYIELPIKIYHPSHVSELKRMLSLLCLKCLKLKTNKFQVRSGGVAERLFSCCEEASQISIREIKSSDGAQILQLKLPSRMGVREGCWSFLERYGYRYGDELTRTLLPCEVMEMLRRIPQDTRKKLARKGYFPQDGYIMQYVPVPPNCLSVPDVSDGVSVMSTDLSISMLKKVLRQVEMIKSSRSGEPNFQSHEAEVFSLQSLVDQYLQVRGTAKSARDVEERFGVHKESNGSSTKAWLEKMRTLFIRKGSGFSSRSVITGDSYKRVNEIGIPFEIAQRITFEERVNAHNVQFLQDLVDNKLCLTYRDGSSTYSLREGSKGHTFLRPGQVVHRRIMDGDVVFINRPPTTHKHSLQALSVYVHDGHTVKINPLICGPLSADFDGDCIHLFYPQSLAAKAEVLELFSVEKQLLSSHSGNLNLQLTSDSLLSLKAMFKANFFDKAAAQQLNMFVSSSLPQPAFCKARLSGPIWTALQILQTALPSQFDCIGERYLISNGDVVKLDITRDVVQAVINEIVISIFFEKGPDPVFKFFNSLQPMLMENLFSEGFSVGLEDFYMSRASKSRIQRDFKIISSLLGKLRTSYNELLEMQLESHIRHAKLPIAGFILRSSSMGDLIDCKSESATTKVVQQIGFLGLQISDRGKFYTKTLVEDMASHFESRYPSDIEYPSAKHGFIESSFFHGLDPYEEMVHSISAREVMVRSTRGLSEPGTLFKNLMAILRDVVICYDGTVRNVCSNSIIQFEYGLKAGIKAQSLFPAGEPVGVLAATAMSNPAYKAVLDSTPSSNSSWELMKEILQCRVNFRNDVTDRRVILYFNHCGCGKFYCQEKLAYVVKNHLEKVILKDISLCFMVEYGTSQTIADAGVVGHIHLKKMKLQELNVSMEVIHRKCTQTLASFGKKKKIGSLFKRIEVSVSECCSFHCADGSSGMPCLAFFWRDITDIPLERSLHLFADVIYPVLLDTIIKGDPRISSASIVWVSQDASTWIRNPLRTQKGELALDVAVEKSAVKQSGGAWRVVLDSCVPVLHMIDTTRSIPYAIKQVQELLGISCAFDQAVQRLSSSVTKVAKGVLKEHLILLANSMTCAGNLVGFTSGGYKALSRSLDVQVPFTEATLFTPRKCFERAAEKCHTDTLSSVVASCAWGKHVAVGTGSCFDLLWDQKEACLNQEDRIDVYELLNMVRSSASGEESATACLGAEVDDLMLADEIDDWNLSPERNLASDKPVFDDGDEFKKFLENQQESESGWDSAAPWKSNANANWGTKKSEVDAVPSTNAQEETRKSGDWDTGAAWGRSAGWASSTAGDRSKDNHSIEAVQPVESLSNKSSWDAAPSKWDANANWGTKKSEVDAVPSMNAEEETRKSGDQDTGAAWGRSAGWASSTAKDWSKDTRSIEAVQLVESLGNNSSWDKLRSAEVSHSWGSSDEHVKSASSPGRSLPNAGGSNKWEKQQQWDRPKSSEETGKSGWGSPKESVKAASSPCWSLPNAGGSDKSERQQPWGRPESPEGSHGWGSSKERVKAASSPGWNFPNAGGSNKRESQQQWDRPKSPEESHGWGSPKEPVKAASSPGWNLPNAGGSDNSERQQPWGRSEPLEDSHGWGSSKEHVKVASSPGWNLPSAGDSDKKERQQWWDRPKSPEALQGWGSPKESVKAVSSPGWNLPNAGGSDKSEQWGRPESPKVLHGWGSTRESTEAENSQGWGKPNPGGSDANERKPQWGKQRGEFKKSWEGSRGWGTNNGEWKGKNRPPKPQGNATDESSVSLMYTATRQRLDMFTSQEQDILSDIEPLMRSIRKIIHQSGYNDGDPLSAADQSYVLDNVLNYHPEKAAKMGAGVDHVMVDKHSSFQESRCLYVVSTDGGKQDFSYRKCLENFIQGKYPDLAEEFIGKYFKPRQRGSQPQTPVAEPETTQRDSQPQTPVAVPEIAPVVEPEAINPQ